MKLFYFGRSQRPGDLKLLVQSCVGFESYLEHRYYLFEL
jgi:hypothetical protein